MKPHLERTRFGWASLDRTRFVWASNIMTHTHSHLYACMCQQHMSQHMTPHNHNCCVVLYRTESPGDESHDLCFSWKPAARSRGPRLSAWLVVRSPRPAHGAWNHIRPIVKPIVARHRLLLHGAPMQFATCNSKLFALAARVFAGEPSPLTSCI